jgi:hypothetical protein
MYFLQDKQTDFSVVIKIRAKLPNPWRWEIYCAGHSRAIEQSSEFFSTVSAAKKAGDRALSELFEKQLPTPTRPLDPAALFGRRPALAFAIPSPRT